MFDSFGRADWLRRHLVMIPGLILHIRAQAIPSMSADSEPRVSGSKEKTLAPLQVAPIDDADDLWARTCSLAAYYAERSGEWREMPDCIDRQWTIQTSAELEVIGFASTDADRIYMDAVEVTRYLNERAGLLAMNHEYHDPVVQLVGEVAKARARYPESAAHVGAKLKCPKCLRHGVEPEYTDDGELAALACRICGSRKKS